MDTKETLLKIKLDIETKIDQIDGDESLNAKWRKGYIDALVEVKHMLWWQLKDM